jgi:AcrR family transcriptional regulator
MTMSAIGRRRALALQEGNPGYLDKREQMLKAAVTLFKEKGFEATTLADIAQVVGVDRASIYYYVESKEELLRETVTRVSAGNLELAKALRKSQLSAAERIRAFIESTIRTYDENYPQVFVFIQEDMSKIAPTNSAWSKEMRRQVREFEATVDDLLREGVEDGSFRDDLDLRVVAKGLWGMLNWTHRWHKPGGATSADVIAQTFAELFLAGIAAKPRSRRRQ